MLCMLYQEMKGREACPASGFGFGLKNLYKFSSYLTENTIRLHFNYWSVTAI